MRQQSLLPEEPDELPLRIADDCPKCRQPLVLTRSEHDTFIECSGEKCQFREYRDTALAELMRRLLRARSRLAELDPNGKII